LDQTREQIKFDTEVIKLIVVLMVATGGGALALIGKGIDSAREAILVAGGMIISITCVIITYVRYKITQNLINRL
jgi:hypothetical protein